MVPLGSSDIMWSVDFDMYADMYRRVAGSHIENKNPGARCVARDEGEGGAGSGSSSFKLGRGRVDVRVRVMKTRVFMEEHAHHSETKTLMGYNPLLEDFSNTSFLVASTEHQDREA